VKILRATTLLLSFGAILLALYTLPRVQLENDILALFPATERRADLAAAADHIRARVDRKILLLLGGQDRAAVREAVPEFLSHLRDCGCFSTVGANPDRSAWTELHKLYTQHTPALLSRSTRESFSQNGADALVRNSLLRLMTNPGPALANQLQQDPLGTLADFLAQTNEMPDGFRLDEDGSLWIENGAVHYLLIQAELADSPYSVRLQENVRSALEKAKAAFAEAAQGEVLQTGALFYAMAGTEQARSEISTVGLGSALGIVALLLIVFRAFNVLVLALFPIAVGVLLGLSVCHWLFGRINIVALVFGASLVGVAIDYALHFFTLRQTSGTAWQVDKGLRELLPALTLGLASSVAAYLSFSLAGFPGLTQMAVFSATGLCGSYAVVVGCYPLLLRKPARSPAPAYLLTLSTHYHDGFSKYRHHLRSWKVALMGLVVAAGLVQLHANDDLRSMQTPNEDVIAMDLQVRALIGHQAALQYFVVAADSEEALLQSLEALEPQLQSLREQGHISQYQSLSQWLPSAGTQTANRALWQTQVMESGALNGLFEHLGVRADIRSRLLQHHSEPVSPLTLEQLAPLLKQLPEAPVWYHHDGRSYGVILLQGLTNIDAVRALAETRDDLFWMDPVSQIQQLLRDYRLSATLLLPPAYLLILLALLWRYSWRDSLAIVAPPLMATLLTLSVLGWLGQPLSIFNLMALALVLGLGLDAALFMRECDGRHRQTLVAIGLSSITTLLSFGLLAFSATAAIRSFGLTALLGISGCLFLAPLALPRALDADAPTQNQ
jgi:predicted exporter